MLSLKNLSVVMVIALFADASFAGRLHNVRGRQHARIHQGVKSGNLTREEAKDLRQDQRELRREERAMRKDGLTAEERQEIRQGRRQASQEIYQEKHDDQTR